MRRVMGAVALMGALVLGCMSWDPSADNAWEKQGDSEADVIPRSEMKNPWARAKVGDWIMERGKGLSARQIKREVVKVSDREVLVFLGGDPDNPDDYYVVDLQEKEQEYKPVEELEGFVSKTEETLDFGGKTIRVTRYTLEGNGVKIVNTISDEVPFDGMIKSVRNGEIGYEIIDFNKN